jgi:DNA-binding CsgD family transcriptional regulator
MSTPEKRPPESEGRHNQRGAPTTRALPCFDGHGPPCEEAWKGIADTLKLSPREAQIASRVFADQSDREIAQALGLSRGTIHTHLERLHEKLEVHSRVQLARRVFAAYLAWLVASPPPTGCPLRSRLESF